MTTGAATLAVVVMVVAGLAVKLARGTDETKRERRAALRGRARPRTSLAVVTGFFRIEEPIATRRDRGVDRQTAV